MRYFYRENSVLEKMTDSYFSDIADYNNKRFGGKLSVILLGSLSRGEGTWEQTESGYRLLSDIEYFTVYPDGFNEFSEYTAETEKIGKSIFGKQSALFHIDNSFVSKGFLSEMERKLLTYDAKSFGKCVVGEDTVKLLPDITIENINFFDIRDVLTHRAFSVLYYGLPMKKSEDISGYTYCLAKNSLDLMTVILAKHGILASGFINREREIEKLDIDEKLKSYFRFCLAIKLCEEPEEFFSPEEAKEIFLKTEKELALSFKVPFKYVFINFKAVTRRFLGICKRSIKYRHLPKKGHLNRLIESIEKENEITETEKLDNLVINGYPLPDNNGTDVDI